MSKRISILLPIVVFVVLVGAVLPSLAFGAGTVSYSSASNSNLSLYTTVPNDDGGTVFIFKGLADGESSEIGFTVSGDCPMVAMTGGASFTGQWSCTAGTISASVTYHGGMSFGPATDETQGSFYVTFSDPPAPPGSDAPPSDFNGIQISVYGDVSHWSLSGEPSGNGASFGVEITGTQGGEAHFAMLLPQAAVTFLGGVLGVKVGGKSDPFATVTNNEDGSAAISVDITKLQSAAISSKRFDAKASKSVTKRITASERDLSIASNKTSVKAGGALSYAMCAGTEFTAGDKVPVKFLVGGKSNKAMKSVSFQLDSSGCATKRVKVAKGVSGSLQAKIKYKGANAKSTTKVTK